MVWEDGPLKGLPKGLKQVALERFGEARIRGLRQDALVELLEAEEDFRYTDNFYCQSLLLVLSGPYFMGGQGGPWTP